MMDIDSAGQTVRWFYQKIEAQANGQIPSLFNDLTSAGDQIR